MTPAKDGRNVYQGIKSDDNTSPMPIIIVGARAQNISRVVGKQIAKVDDYIVKPFSSKGLLASVDRVLRARQSAG